MLPSSFLPAAAAWLLFKLDGSKEGTRTRTATEKECARTNNHNKFTVGHTHGVTGCVTRGGPLVRMEEVDDYRFWLKRGRTSNLDDDG